jgi:type II secretory pathway pseudopilin PulG
LYELLIAIGVIAVLAGILVPTIAKVRSSAMRVVCVSRLRDLTLATQAYQLEFGVLPDPAAIATATGSGTGVLASTPQGIDTRLLRQLQKYLKYPTITSATQAGDLPPFLQCPYLENEPERGPFATMDPADAYFYTGYAYIGRVEEQPRPSPTLISLLGLPPNLLSGLPGLSGLLPPAPITLGPLQIQVGVALKKDRAATAKPQKRAVVWADDVHMDSSSGIWQYAHPSGRASAGPKPLTYRDAAGLAGQHRAFTDGAVEWTDRGDMGLTEPNPPPSLLDLTASFKIGSNTYWWY